MKILGSRRGELWPLGKCRSSKGRTQSEHTVKLGVASAELSEAGGTASAARHDMLVGQACSHCELLITNCRPICILCSLFLLEHIYSTAPLQAWTQRASRLRKAKLLPRSAAGRTPVPILRCEKKLSAQTQKCQHSPFLTFLAKERQTTPQQQEGRPVLGLDRALSAPVHCQAPSPKLPPTVLNRKRFGEPKPPESPQNLEGKS